MDFVERVETSSDPLNFTSSTPHSNNNTTNNTVDECDELETKTNSNTTKTNNPTMRSTSFPIEVPVTEVSFSLQCTGTSTKTDNKSKMFTVYNIKVSALSTRWIVVVVVVVVVFNLHCSSEKLFWIMVLCMLPYTAHVMGHIVPHVLLDNPHRE